KASAPRPACVPSRGDKAPWSLGSNDPASTALLVVLRRTTRVPVAGWPSSESQSCDFFSKFRLQCPKVLVFESRLLHICIKKLLYFIKNFPEMKQEKSPKMRKSSILGVLAVLFASSSIYVSAAPAEIDFGP